MKQKLPILLIILLLSSTILAAVYQELLLYGGKAAANRQTPEQVFEIRSGEGFRRITERLAGTGIIGSPLKFKLLARIRGFDKKIKAGEYHLSASLSPNEIFAILISGRVALYKLTVPEGYTMHQIATLVEKAGIGTAAGFLATAQDAQFAHQLKIDAETFEGYLFPETYHFPRNASAKKIISTMTQRFWATLEPAWYDRLNEIGFSLHQAVTLASIIEKETGVPHERPLISSVFHNRLKKKMRLESDPTVIYGIKNFKGNLTRRHLKEKTRYNTYRIRGLPPGPIANPGHASMRAALYPAESDYLFFVSRKDRTHQFSTNIRDHNRAVRKYQLGRR